MLKTCTEFYSMRTIFARSNVFFEKSTEIEIAFRSADGKTSFFDIKKGDLHGDNFVPLLLVIYVLRTSLDKDPHLVFTLSSSR